MGGCDCETEAEAGAATGAGAAAAFGVAAGLEVQCSTLTSCCGSSSGDGGMEGSGDTGIAAATATEAPERGSGDLEADSSAVERVPFAGKLGGRFSPRWGDTDAGGSSLCKHAVAADSENEGTAGTGTAATLATCAVTVAAFSLASLTSLCCCSCSCGVSCEGGVGCFCEPAEAEGVVRRGRLSPTRGFACVNPGDSATGVAGVDDAVGAGLSEPRRRPELPMRACIEARARAASLERTRRRTEPIWSVPALCARAVLCVPR